MKISLIATFLLFSINSLSWSSDSEDDESYEYSKYTSSRFRSPDINRSFTNECISNYEFRDHTSPTILNNNNSDSNDEFPEVSRHTNQNDSDNLETVALVPSYTNEEKAFFDVPIEDTNSSTDYQDISIAFKECLADDFSTYLMLKNKLLYMNHFLKAQFNDLQRHVKLQEQSSNPNVDPSEHDYFLTFIYNKIIYRSKTYPLNLKDCDTSKSRDIQTIFDHLPKFHPCVLFLCSLLGRCPTTIFLENKNELAALYPNFYQDYQEIKENAGKKAPVSKTQIKQKPSLEFFDLTQEVITTNGKKLEKIVLKKPKKNVLPRKPAQNKKEQPQIDREVIQQSNNKNANTLTKRTQEQPERNVKKPKLYEISSKKPQFEINHFKIEQYQPKIKPIKPEIVHPSTANITSSQNPASKEQDILGKIKNYIRPSSFESNSALHELITTNGFFEVIEKQIFELVDSPRIVTMLTDILENSSFCFKSQRRAFEIISNFLKETKH